MTFRVVAAVLAGIGAIASARLIAVRRVAGTVEAMPARPVVSQTAA